MSSNDRPAAADAGADALSGLPAALPSMWRALKRGYVAEPALLSIAFALSLLAALPDALMALWLKLLADGLLDNLPDLVLIAALGLGLSATLTWLLRVVSDRTQRRFRDRVTIAGQDVAVPVGADGADLHPFDRGIDVACGARCGGLLAEGVPGFDRPAQFDLDVVEHRRPDPGEAELGKRVQPAGLEVEAVRPQVGTHCGDVMNNEVRQ